MMAALGSRYFYGGGYLHGTLGAISVALLVCLALVGTLTHTVHTESLRLGLLKTFMTNSLRLVAWSS
jgi:hypothetical protein